MQLPSEAGLVLNGSYIIFSCVGGYVNTGGSLNVTCNANSSWSLFPKCVSTCGDVPVVANGYASNATSIQYNNNIYQRNVQFTCYPGYVRVNSSGQSWVSCSNGVWDPLPVCAGMLLMLKLILN
jgi:hypothetical protein